MRKTTTATVLSHSVALLAGLLMAAACVIPPATQTPASSHEHSPAEVALLEAAAECITDGDRFPHTYGNALTADPQMPHTYSTSITTLVC